MKKTKEERSTPKNTFLRNLFLNNDYFKQMAGRDYDSLLECIDDVEPDFCKVIANKKAKKFIKGYPTQEFLERNRILKNFGGPAYKTPNPYKKLAIRNKHGMQTPFDYQNPAKYAFRSGENVVPNENGNGYYRNSYKPAKPNKLRNRPETGKSPNVDPVKKKNLMKQSVIDGQPKAERKGKEGEQLPPSSNNGKTLMVLKRYSTPQAPIYSTYSNRTMNAENLRKPKYEIDPKKKMIMRENPNQKDGKLMKVRSKPNTGKIVEYHKVEPRTPYSPQVRKALVQRMKEMKSRNPGENYPRGTFTRSLNRRTAENGFIPEERYTTGTTPHLYDGSAKYLSRSQYYDPKLNSSLKESSGYEKQRREKRRINKAKEETQGKTYQYPISKDIRLDGNQNDKKEDKKETTEEKEFEISTKKTAEKKAN